MTSTLKVQNIAHTGGTNAIEIDSSGNLTISQPIGFNATINGTQSSQDHDPAAKIADWSITHKGGWNSGMLNQTTGVITIPKTGYYFFSANIRMDGFSGSYFNIDLAGWDGSAIQAGAAYRLLRHLESATASDYTTAQVQGIVKATQDDEHVWSLYTSGDSSVTLDSDSQITCYYIG